MEEETQKVVEYLENKHRGMWIYTANVDEIIKAFKEVANIKCCDCGSDEDLVIYCDSCYCINNP